MACDVSPHHHELLQWRVDVVKLDVGNESVIPASTLVGFAPCTIAARPDEIGEDGEIGKPARVGGVRRVAADARK